MTPDSQGQSTIFYVIFIGLIAGAIFMIVFYIKKCFCPNAKCLEFKRSQISKIHAAAQQIQVPQSSQQQITSNHQTQLSTIIPFIGDDETAHSSNLSIYSHQINTGQPVRRQMLQEAQQQADQPSQNKIIIQEPHKIQTPSYCQKQREKGEPEAQDQKKKKRFRRVRRQNIESSLDSQGRGGSDIFTQQRDLNENRAALEKEITHLQFCRKYPRKRYLEAKELLFPLRDKSFIPKECMLCQNSIINREFCRVLPCMHVFHQPCIDAYFEDLQKCPICQLDLTQDHQILNQNDLMQSIYVDNEHFFSEHLQRNDAWKEAVKLEDLSALERQKLYRKTTDFSKLKNQSGDQQRWGSETIYQDFKELRIIKISNIVEQGPPSIRKSFSASPKHIRRMTTGITTIDSGYEFTDVNESYNNQREQWIKVLMHQIRKA
ncbi:hypothetical protein FGO68_gene15671 [Halteria grandinella]|uniref:RING-type domain-containing protein n=1 Tax=Halteria grandinella TaxID=5974 RepID=A0A8J8NR50_HALGN|nr:hypothetical protein FGO68_gene15671 [Halteria grandinella]